MKNYKSFIKENDSLFDNYDDEYKHNEDEIYEDEQDKEIIDEIFPDIIENCEEYLNMLEIGGKMLWRGMDIDYNIDIITPKKDREPVDTPSIIQNMIDDLFEEKFGLRPRSQGTFAYQTQSTFKQYGDEYMIFPFDGFKYVWSYDIVDFYVEIKDYLGYYGVEYLKNNDIKDINMIEKYYYEHKSYISEYDVKSLEEFKNILSLENIKIKLKKMVDTYQDNDLKYLLDDRYDKEVCIVCEKYYAVSDVYKYLIVDKITEYITNKK